MTLEEALAVMAHVTRDLDEDDGAHEALRVIESALAAPVDGEVAEHMMWLRERYGSCKEMGPTPSIGRSAALNIADMLERLTRENAELWAERKEIDEAVNYEHPAKCSAAYEDCGCDNKAVNAVRGILAAKAAR